jgi:AmmeMemoRadiSam system protein B
VAGTFYPGVEAELRALVDDELATAQATRGAAPKAIIVPHAGYGYSGPVAASAYARLLPWRHRFARVVLLGPAHRGAVESMAVT